MKRPIKPFVVEVRKGQKKGDEPVQTSQPKPAPKPGPRNASGDDALRRAQAMLFSPSPAPSPAPAEVTPPGRTGRILASLDEPTPPVVADAPARKRGRPPGSLNKPKSEAKAPAGAPKRRGRPPKNPPQPLRQIDPVPAQAPTNPAFEPRAAGPAPARLPRKLQQLIGLETDQLAEQVARIPAGERWKRRLRGPARLAFERRHTKV